MTNPVNNKKSIGRNAKSPKEIPKKGWKQILLRVKDEIKNDNVSIVAAGVAFYFFLALFPAIAAVVSIYGLVVTPAQVEQQMTEMANALPAEAYQLVSDILHRVAGKSGETLGWSLIVSILLSLWSSNKATSAVFEGVNIAYNESDDRGFIRKKALTLAFTLGGILTGIISAAFVVGFPAVIDKLNLPGTLQALLAFARWIVLAIIIYLVIAVTYKFAPHRASPKFLWINPGAISATVLWLGGSLLFTYYVNNFGSYDKAYGSIAAVVILLLWFYLTGFIIILGAEINSEIEHQTHADTTAGPDKPPGKRGAYYADRVADGYE